MVKRRATYRPVYDDFFPYFPPSKPIKTSDGIESRTKRGAFGESWWAKRWLAALESYSVGSRLQRGRSYARGGQVLEILIAPGLVTASVQGSRPTPYKISIRLPALKDPEWERVLDAISQQAIFAAQLLGGEMPQAIEEAFKTAHVPLFPASSEELITACSCPDFANPCKHIAAVYYLLGERFDADPFLIFKLRGRSREEVIAALRDRRTAALGAEPTAEATLPVEAAPALKTQIQTYWQMSSRETLYIPVAAPDIQAAVLRRLGESPAATQQALKALYAAMTRYAMAKALGDEAK